MSTIVTVIIPVFDNLKGLSSALTALAKQSIPAEQFEVIIVDNGSVPPIRLGDVKYPFRHFLITCSVKGSYAARNAGVRAASGQVLAFTDADCEPRSDWLAMGLSYLQSAQGSVVVGGKVLIRTPAYRTGTSLYQYLTGFSQDENIAIRGFAATANMIVQRESFRSVGEFDERLLSGGDLEWCWRAADAGYPVRFAPAAVVETLARNTLLAAIRQTRRVSGGRRALLLRLAPDANPYGLTARRRSRLSGLVDVVCSRELTSLERIRVITVAVLLRLVALSEDLRLSLGGRPERR